MAFDFDWRIANPGQWYPTGMGTFEYFDHSADVGIQIEASSLPDLFRTAGRALMEWMGPAPDNTLMLNENVVIEAEGIEDLLVRWLQELLFLFHQRHAYFEDASRIEVTDHRIEATVLGRSWEVGLESSFQEVKAITYHKLHVDNRGGVWRARIILDV